MCPPFADYARDPDNIFMTLVRCHHDDPAASS